MTEELTITIHNGISKITIGGGSCDYKLTAYSGFAAADFDVKLSAGGASDGGYISTARLGSRTLDIRFDFRGRGAESVRQSLISFFAPGRRLTVTAQRGGIVRTIEGHASDFDITETNRYAHSVVNLSVLCPDPYFKATAAAFYSGTVVTPMFHLPCHFPCVIGVERSTGKLEIINTGDTYADMSAVLAANTAATNPYILNHTNGKIIKIIGTLNTGASLHISTVRRGKGAWIGNARCTIDPSSQFSDFLAVGLNQIECGSDEGTGSLSADVAYTALFLGV